MVRVFHNISGNKIADIIYVIFKLQSYVTHFVNVNHPGPEPCVYAFWHSHNCCTYGLPNRDRVNVMISRSRDGNIIASVTERLGIKVVHGSKGKKGATEATLKMIEELKKGNYGAITVDGPNGPAKVCKDGVVKIAKLAGVPIVPVYMYSSNPTCLKFPTWDSFRLPFTLTHLINIYGEPIYVDKNNTPEQDEEIRLKVEKSLAELEEKAPQAFKDAYWFGIWKKKKRK